MLDTTDIDLLTSSLSFFEHLSDSQKDMLIRNAKKTTYGANQSLHCGENDCVGILIVKSGTIRTYLLSDEGREVTLYRLDAGDVCVLSAACVLQTITFDVYIDAESTCEIIQVSSNVFSKLMTENIYVETFTYKLATERFSDVMWAMQQILFTSFDKRLATFLLDESAKTHSDVINMTHEQIAKYLGSAREVVSRMLKYFVRENLVTLSRGGITLVDKKKLRAFLLIR